MQHEPAQLEHASLTVCFGPEIQTSPSWGVYETCIERAMWIHNLLPQCYFAFYVVTETQTPGPC